MRHTSECVALLDANLIGHVLVAPGKGDRLKSDRLHLIDVLRRKLDDSSDAVIVDGVDYCRDQRDFDADTGEVFNRLLLYVEEVAHPAMPVLLFADSVKLQIDTVLAGRFRGFAKLNVLGKANSVRRCQYAIEANLFRVRNSFKIVRRKRRLAA